jgi:hypothetical protein
MPETTTTYYEANNMSCSASTIMAIGYDTDAENKKTLKIITRLADIDTEGSNPTLSYSFEKDSSNPLVRVLPMEFKWKEHPLPEGAQVTDQITILQTGNGNNARELRVVGEFEGQKGYFYKSISDETWKFEAQDGVEASSILEMEKQDEPAHLKNRVRDLTVVINGKNGESIDDAQLESFGKRSTVSKVNFVYNNKRYSLLLYRRMAVWSFLGINSYRYDLVIPEKDRQDLKELFGDTISYEVKVKRGKKGVAIVPKKGDFAIETRSI